MDIESIKQEFLAAQGNDRPAYPSVLDAPNLEDAFKHPVCDEQGYAESLPVITASYSHGETPDGIKVLSLKSATTATALYSKYLDEEALVWDAARQELYLYIPDARSPRMAFKSTSWACARRLAPEYRHLNLRDIYGQLKEEMQK